MKIQSLLSELRTLEVELHQLEVRSSADRLSALLHESFIEFGCSGSTFGKVEVIDRLSFEASAISLWSQDFSVQEITKGVALLTYKSANQLKNGRLQNCANRSSIWQHDAQKGWQLRFHQGTTTAAFVVNAT